MAVGGRAYVPHSRATATPESAVNALNDLAISPSGFVFDPRTGATFSVNEVGRVLLEGLRDGHGLAALGAHLAARFDVDGADLHRDVLEFVRRLQGEGLLDARFELEA